MGKDSYALATGLFMAALITGTVITAIWLGDVQRQTRTYVAATRDSVTGLKAGSTVYYRGIEAGKVASVRFDASDPAVIVVSMELDQDVRLTRGVYATLELQGVTGLTRIALKNGGDNPEPLPSGSDPDNRIPIQPSLIDRLSVSGEETVQETHELMVRMNRLLDEKNVRHIENILVNVETATGRFIALQEQAGEALAQAPELMAAARRTLSEINNLAGEFKQLSGEMRGNLAVLSRQSGGLLETGTAVGRQLLQTTLPRTDSLLLRIQAATRRFERVAATLETDPQAFLLGSEPNQPAPGEPGFRDLP